MSTVQEVKAADDLNEIDSNSTVVDVYENVEAAFAEWNPSQTVFVNGDKFNPTDEKTTPASGGDAVSPTAEISTFIKTELGWTNDTDNVYVKNGFALTIKPADYADDADDGLHQVVNKIKIIVTKGDESTDADLSLAGIGFYNGAKIVEELGTVDLSEIEVTSADTTLTIKSKVEAYVLGLIEEFLPTAVVEEDVEVTASVSKNVANGKVTYTVDSVKVTCGIGTPQTVNTKNATFTVDSVASDEAKAAMEYLKTALTEVEVDAAADLNPNQDPIAANGKIKAAVEKALKDTEYAAYAENSVVAGSILTKGVWTGTITLTDGANDRISDTFEIKLVTDKAEDTSIIRVELVEPKNEVEVDTSLDDALKLRLVHADGSVEVKKVSDAVQAKDVVYDATGLDSDQKFKTLGEYSVVFHTTDTETTPTVTFTADVVKTTGKNDIGNKLGVEEFSTVTTDDLSVLVPVFDTDGAFTGLKALKSGKVTVTAIAKNGTTYETAVTVSANGTLKYGKAELQATDRVVVNTAANLGFVATEVKSTSQKPVVLDSDTVAEAELDTLNGVSVIRITPVARGTAEFKVTGGVDKDLSTTITVEVGKDGEVTVKPKQVKVTEVTATNATASKLSKLVINSEKLKTGVGTSYDIDNLGLTSSDNLVITVGKKTHRVPALDIDKAIITKTSEDDDPVILRLELYYGIAEEGTSNIYEVTLGQSSTMLSNDINTLGLVATEVVSIDNSIAEAVENNWVDVEITEDAEGNAILLISKGKEAPDNGTAVITVADENGLTAEVTATFEDGVLSAEVTTTCSTEIEMAVAPEKTEYTLGDSVDVDGGFFTYRDSNGKGHKVSLTSDMLSINTAQSTYSYNATEEEYTNASQKIIVKYGATTNKVAQKSTEDSTDATYTVKPATSSVSASTLGLVSGEKILNLAEKGDAIGVESLIVTTDKDGRSLSIAALQTDKSGAVVLTTNKGNSISVSVSVDEDGKISAEVVKTFKSSVATVKNNTDTLGLVATEATSDNTDVALVNMAGDRITITSVAPGNATITVTDGDNYATIDVTVDEFGNITIGDIVKIGDNGFVRGDLITEGTYAGQYNWYYYVDGVMVKSDWEKVNENGTDVWYHFDKDGKMQRGWISDESGWKVYYLDFNGRMYHDTWANADANEALNMPAGMYYLQSDGSVQMNGWAPAPGSENVWWFCAAGNGLFVNIPSNWSSVKLR